MKTPFLLTNEYTECYPTNEVTPLEGFKRLTSNLSRETPEILIMLIKLYSIGI